jgi:hypothetical protein
VPRGEDVEVEEVRFFAAQNLMQDEGLVAAAELDRGEGGGFEARIFLRRGAVAVPLLRRSA